mgnify:FL=1
MKYNFDEPVDRSQNRSAKYDERVKNFGTDDVIPLWIADMDFKTAQPIIDACKKEVPVVKTGVFGAEMEVALINDGPFTIVLDSETL